MIDESRIKLDIDGVSADELEKYREIIYVLFKSGGLSGVKGGKTIIHFDHECVFQGVQFDYWPWRRRKKLDNSSL